MSSNAIPCFPAAVLAGRQFLGFVPSPDYLELLAKHWSRKIVTEYVEYNDVVER